MGWTDMDYRVGRPLDEMVGIGMEYLDEIKKRNPDEPLASSRCDDAVAEGMEGVIGGDVDFLRMAEPLLDRPLSAFATDVAEGGTIREVIFAQMRDQLERNLGPHMDDLDASYAASRRIEARRKEVRGV